MITSADILHATGLRSAKTLTRWHQQGLIPPPSMGTHPSGRGKIAFWPDWVLDRCVRIVELQKQGHTLSSAVVAIEMEKIERNLERAADDPTDRLEAIAVKVGDRDVPLLDLFGLEVIRLAEPLLRGAETRRSLFGRLRQDKVIATALQLLAGGYNPVALFEADRVAVVPDFVVSHWLAGDSPASGAQLLLPLLPPLRTAFERLGRDFPFEPKAAPAPHIWVKEGDDTVQYSFYPGGLVGFELLHDTARIIGGK